MPPLIFMPKGQGSAEENWLIPICRTVLDFLTTLSSRVERSEIEGSTH